MSKVSDYITKELKGATGLTWQYNETSRHFYSSPADDKHIDQAKKRLNEIAPSLNGPIRETNPDSNGNRKIYLSESRAKSITTNYKHRRKEYQSTANVPAQGR